MARLDSLNILTTGENKKKLAESYGKVIENIQKSTISGLLKNADLSGTPEAGTVEAKRFVNSASNTYGTARAGGKGQALKTGFEYAKNCEIIVTIDADGQHNPSEIPLLIKPIEDGVADLVNGSRYINNQDTSTPK